MRPVLAVLALAAVPTATEPRADVERCLGADPVHRWELPILFREVSGLALATDGRLFLHNDEQGVLGSIDYRNGRVLGTYRLGPGTPRDDFEGIAIAGSRMFLLSSQAILYELDVPPAGPADLVELPFRRRATGLERWCEFEGLAFDRAPNVLLLACKTPLDKSLADQVTVFRWSIDAQRLATPDRVTLAEAGFARGKKGKTFHPSGLDRDPVSGNLVMVAGPEQAIAEVDGRGQVLMARSLGPGHRQPEGVALTKDGFLIVADEGMRGPGVIAVYSCTSR